jgi:hypothetical protein
MATIANTSLSTEVKDTFSNVLEQIQKKYNEFVDYASEKVTYWQGRAIEVKDAGLEKIKEIWKQAQPTFDRVKDYLNVKLEALKAVNWKGHAIKVKDKTLSALNWAAGHALFIAKHLWFAIEKVAEVAYLIVTNAPLAMFNSASYIPLISVVPAFIRGIIINVIHVIASVTLNPFINLITGGPKKVIKNFIDDWHSIFSRTVRASTEWVPILGNILWLYYDFKMLALTEEERQKYAIFGVFWG